MLSLSTMGANAQIIERSSSGVIHFLNNRYRNRRTSALARAYRESELNDMNNFQAIRVCISTPEIRVSMLSWHSPFPAIVIPETHAGTVHGGRSRLPEVAAKKPSVTIAKPTHVTNFQTRC
jgi:hypothetical protein